MLIRNLPNSDLLRLQKVFRDEVKADLIGCWGNKTLEKMTDVFRSLPERRQTLQLLNELCKKHSK